MRTSVFLFLMLVFAAPVDATMLIFDLKESPGVRLVKVDIEDSGAVYQGARTGPTFETSKGEKIFRAIITADVTISEAARQRRSRYFERFQLRGSAQVNGQLWHVYRIRDVVRFPINVLNGGTIDFGIHFVVDVPGLTFSYKDGLPFEIDRMIRFADNQHFGIIPKPFSGADSSSPRTVCLEQRPDPRFPMVMECVKWGTN